MGKEEGDEGKSGKGEKMKKGVEFAEAMMSGAIKKQDGGRSENGEGRGEPGEERAGSEEIRGRRHTNHQGGDGDVSPIEETAVNQEGPIVVATEGAEGTATEEVAEGTARSRSISPMPSEHSASSVQAHVHFQRPDRRARSGAGSQHDAPNDSEEEEAEDSSDDDDASDVGQDEATQAAKAAKKAEGPTDVGGATPGLRGGGGSELDDAEDDEERWYSFGEEEEEEYNGHEDFDDEYKTVNADQMDIKILDHVAENDGPGLGTKAGPAADPDHGQDIKLQAVSKDDGLLWKDHLKPGPSPAVHQAAEPKHGEDNQVSAKYDAGQVSKREHTESDSSPALEQATKQKLEGCAEEIAQSSSHPGDRPQHPAVLSGNRLKTGDAVATELKGKPGDRESRPYGLAGVGEKTEVHRGEPGRPIVWNRYDHGAADIIAGPSEQSRHRAAGTTEPTCKRRSTRANTEPATAQAPDSAQAGSSEDRSRPRRAAAKPRVPGSFPEADFVTEDAWYSEELFGQEKPRRTGRPYCEQGARRYEEASYAKDSARNTTSGANEFRRRGQGGPRVRVVHTHEEYVADGFFTDGPTRGAIPQTGRIYRGGPYQSFESWNDGVRPGPPYGGPHTPRFAGAEPFRAPGGGAQRTRGQSYAEERPSRGRGPARGKKVQPDSSDDDDSSSDDTVDRSPSPSPSPPPQRRRRKGTGERPSRQGGQPPAYLEVDSSKTAPLNHYATLGLNPRATAKE